MSDHSSADAVAVHAASDRRLNPDRRRPPVITSDGFAGTWKGLIQTGAVLAVLVALWGAFRLFAAIQDAPAGIAALSTRFDQFERTQKTQLDSLNSFGTQVRGLAKEVTNVQDRVSDLEKRQQTDEAWRAAMEQLKQTRAQQLEDFDTRLRDVEHDRPRVRRSDR